MRGRGGGWVGAVVLLLCLVPGGAPSAQPAVAMAAVGGAGPEVPTGRVHLSVALWSRLSAAVQQPPPLTPPPVGYGVVERRVAGAFDKGLLRGTLTLRFEVLATGEPGGGAVAVAVPLLEAGASLAEVRLDGAEASPVREGGLYVLRVSTPGAHEAVVRFHVGEEQERFARRVRFALPADGGTAFDVRLPETDIEPRTTGGVVTAMEPVAEGGGGTLVRGRLGATGLFDLAWARRVTHRAEEPARMECRVETLFALGESMVEGVALFDLSLREGETDRIDLALPPDVEIVDVTGDAVLQWRTDPAPARAPDGRPGEGQGTLTLLLRWLVTGDLRVAVRFQSAVEPGQPVALRMPFAPPGVPATGAAGVQAPTGLDVQVARMAGAEEVPPRELPAELTDRSPRPLVLGFRFDGGAAGAPPDVVLSVARQGTVSLTGTVVDELEASTVLLADGAEITKVRLHIRNNTRQSLTVQPPPGAVLTHGVVDGQAVRPALVAAAPAGGAGGAGGAGVGGVGGAGALLFPLRQSARLGAGSERYHVVQPGENLGRIAYLYYADPARWPRLLDANPELASADDLYPGMRLLVPPEEGSPVEETRFVIELAWRRAAAPFGSCGTVDVSLPTLDVEVMAVTWHLFLPAGIEPLAFDGNVAALSAPRYDPFRRVRDFLREALGGRPAWAGAKYESILSQRKEIYRAEAGRRLDGDPVLASFPLVGERYRFKRILLGRETARVAVTYLSGGAATAVRWAAFGGTVGLGLVLLLGGPRRWWRWALAAVGLGLLLALAHHVTGVHRRLLWGADLALLLALAVRHGRAARDGLARWLREPWRLREAVTLRNLVLLVGLYGVAQFVLRFPLLLSASAFVVLLASWWQVSRAARPGAPAGAAAGEVDHAHA
jgi:hypothetical protein